MKHGRAAYAKGCRCDVCRVDHAAASREYRARHLDQRRAFERRYRSAKPESQRQPEIRSCAVCGKEFRPFYRGAGRYCSLVCAGQGGRKPVTERTSRQLIRASGHPLANANGRALAYRMTLFDAIGPGAHPCHWCGREVTWVVRKGAGAGRAELVVDHLDGNEHNNAPDNLVPACNNCNTLRAYVRAWQDRTGLPVDRLIGKEMPCPPKLLLVHNDAEKV